MKTKHLILGLGTALLSAFTAKAQVGLEGFIVEKYYQANAADATNAATNGGTLVAGSYVYRVYADLAQGWKFVQAYGNATHPWKITTTTQFFNDPVIGSSIGAQGTSTTSLRQNTRMIDSWLTTGGAALNKAGIPKALDTDGSIGNLQGILANNNFTAFGLPITGTNSADGLTPGTATNIVAPSAFNLSPAADIFDFNNPPGGTFSVTNGAMSALGGAIGTTTDNIVLLGQFTTDGVFGFEFNVQVQNVTTLASELWVAKNPQFGEYSLPALTLAPPTVSITSPANGSNFVTGTAIPVTASATANGTITQVQFFVDGVLVATDLTAPYATTYTAIAGTHTLTANVTDNNGMTSNSSPVIITAANNQAPTISVASPSTALTGGIVTFTATASDVDGTVSSVTFSVDNIAIGTVTLAPYTITWTATPNGNHNVKASATDNLGAVGLSSAVNINVVNNILPSVSITSPANNASFIAPQVVTITANATDADGVITSVQAFVNNVSIGTFTTSGPNYTFTYVSSTLTAVDNIKVVAIDNAAGTSTSSPINVQILNQNGLPYQVNSVKQKCTQNLFCLPVSAALTYTVNDVIGYDVVLNYDPTKVTPTGSITVNGALITPSIVTVANTFSNGVMNISAYLNANALSNSEWNGSGEIFCVEFTKNVSFAPVDTANFQVPFLQESYFSGVIPKLVDNGRYTTYRDTMFDGKLHFWGNNAPMPYDNINTNAYLITNIYGTSNACVTNTMYSPVQPDLGGNFTHNILHGNNISIQRDINPLTDVQFAIQGADITIVRNILLNTATGSLTPSVYQFIAADVNIDGVVSAGDLSQIQLRSIDQIQEFRQTWNYNAAGTNTLGVPSKDWIFIDSTRVGTTPAYAISATYPLNDNVGYSKAKVPVTPFCLPVPVTGLLSCPSLTNEVYKGVMVGDVNGNFPTATSTLNPYRQSAGNKIVIDLSKAVISGNMVDAPVTFVSEEPVYSVDFSMMFDGSALAYNSLVNYPASTEALAYFNNDTKKLKMTASNVNVAPYSTFAPVASVRFEMKSGALDSDLFSNLVGYLNGEVVPFEVQNRAVGIDASNAGNGSVSIFPNPSTGIINITSAADAKVVVCDVTGKEILLQSNVSAGKTLQLSMADFANGVYMVKLYNNDFVSIKKVVLSK